MKRNLLNIITLVLLLAASSSAQTGDKQADLPTEALQSSGGTFTLEKTVIAGGGREMTQMPTNLHGTAGQANAGVQSVGGQFSLYSGFWTPEILGTTAATVSVGGRVLAQGGNGITNVLMSLTDSNGQVRTTLTGTGGYYRFSDVESGSTYIITATGKRYTFAQPSQVVNVSDDTTEINFVGTSEKRLRVF